VFQLRVNEQPRPIVVTTTNSADPDDA